MNISRNGAQNTRLWGYEVSGNYFDMLGVQALRGRVLHAADDLKRGGHPLAVITYTCWQGHFGGDPDIVSKEVKIAGLAYTIIGTELVYTPEIFVPMAMSQQLEQDNWMDKRSDANGLVIGRLKPDPSFTTSRRTSTGGTVSGLR